MDTSADYARRLDAADPLADFRRHFVREEPLIYLDGNSLGRLSAAARARLHHVIDHEWGTRLIRSWNEGWYDLAQRIGARLAPLVGAGPDEVVIADSTSVNLFKLAAAALRWQLAHHPARTRIVTDSLNFPSDVYILHELADLLGGLELVVVPIDEAGGDDPAARLCAAIDDRTALVTVSHTTFKSGYTYDMVAVTAAAHAAGALTLWDLSHSVGALPVPLGAAGADLAIGCTYKYVNGGPGAPALLYVRRDWQARLRNPIAGWFSQRDQFGFGLAYAPAPGMQRFLTGTPPVLALAAIEPGVDLLAAAGIDALRAKSLQQTDYLLALWERELAPLGYTLNSPRDRARRGSHVALGHPHALGIDLALINELEVLPDFRAPDNIRLGIAPLYTTFTEIHTAVARLRQAVVERRYEKYEDRDVRVT